MLIYPAEQSFQKGLEFLEEGRLKEALAFFTGALEIEKRFSTEAAQARYLSYYGLSLSMTGGSLHDAVRCCRKAASMEGYRPEICWNLARVLLAVNRRREAYKVLRRGLSMQPDHSGIKRDLMRMGVRRRPILPFLARGNTINVLLGRLRT